MVFLSDYENQVFKEFSRKLKPYTRDDYLSKIILFKSILENDNKDLFKATKEDSKKFIDFVTKKYAKSTCEKIYSYLHSFYNFLIKENYIEINPFSHVKKPSVSRIKTKDDVLSFDEVNKLISILPQLNIRDRAIIVFLVTTGCLLSEVVNLKWQNLIIDEKDDFFCKIGQGKRERIIKLHPYSWELIMKYRDYLGLPEVVKPTNEFVFKSRTSDSITDRNVRVIVKKALNLAGLDNYSAKDFRHSFATFCLRLGAVDEDVKNYLGWSDKYYAIRYKYVINFVDSQVVDYITDTDKLKINKNIKSSSKE
ncbi:tyrosine-type recombinase/integrase [Tepidibacter formicigenes]|jgi:site-specific recombinase XerD|uniref:Site-specific recombinase XerD n=1 Tax=Tepidibacter formicigenes DSM 15518 TaxID=1123349 RepID=A0A1M6RF57_9FIRM|nr:tyrosine-type recombinase/integrase [Tepidibacter formicigenes]SHK30997.1 Site-specific recombinase XerD [Tepidibacter formicigenes DSM 15518]